MLEQQPNNEILLQLRDSLPAGEESESDGEITVDVEVVNVAGRNIVRVDGVDYYSLAEIPDPEVRDQARQLLLELDDQEFS